MREVLQKAQKAKNATGLLAIASTEEKNAALLGIADLLEKEYLDIIGQNNQDLQNGKEAGLSQALLDRLVLTKERIYGIAEGVRQVAKLTDPIGEVINRWERPNGLVLEKVRVPLGVIGMIYEARPNVTADATALALKTGNAIVLRGGSSAINSNKVIVATIHRALEKTTIVKDVVQLIESEDRESVLEMLKMDQYLDILIPRGGAGLIKTVVENSTIPVLETGVGNCHVYLDASADPKMATEVAINSKTNRPGVCNAAETLLVHEAWADQHLVQLLDALQGAGVELRGCERTRELAPKIKPASEDDWHTEYLDLTMAVKIVPSLEDALKHIATYGTQHTEAIVTDHNDNAK
jgi:glutamate-5-semialdehyde dehydrogenase